MKNSENKKVWFVTGASKGLGLALVVKLLNEGFQVAATSRSKTSLVEAIGETSENFLPLEMNLLDEKSIKSAIDETINKFGAIEIVVNNAGYGQMGTLEELSDKEARTNFDVNVFGVLNVIRQAMPHLRAQRAGHIFNVSSIGGYAAGYPGFGIYCATKFAVSALTESLAAEAKSFGVNATIVYPGYFRTNFLSKDSIVVAKNPITDYVEARQSDDFHQNQMDGNQIGDPDKAAQALIEAASAENPPLHLFLGSDAYELAFKKIDEVKNDLEKWRDLTISTDFQDKSVAV